MAGHALDHALPFFALGDDGLSLFLCHWPRQSPIPVWLPPQATSDEKLILERALAAWEGAGLGVRFQSRTWEGEPPLAGIVFEWVDPGAVEGADTASTIADCAVPTKVDGAADADLTEPVDAELQYASIHLTRARRDPLGREVALTSVELMGSAIHELGHALGFSGHIASGPSVLSRHGQVDNTRRWARRVDSGEPLEAPSLAALYAAPSGARVGWLPLDAGQIEPLHSLAIVATHARLKGPWVRVGDRSARMLWRDESGDSAAVVLLDWDAGVVEPSRLQPRLNRRARQLLSAALGR